MQSGAVDAGQVIEDCHVSVYEQVVDVDSLGGSDLQAVFGISNAPNESEMHSRVARAMFDYCPQLTSVVTMLRSAPDEPMILRSHYNEGVWDPYHVGFRTPDEIVSLTDHLVISTRKPVIRSVDPSTFEVEWWFREPYYCIVPVFSTDESFVAGMLSLGSKTGVNDVRDLISYARVVCGAISFAWERIGRLEEAVKVGQRIEREHVLQTVHDSAVQEIFAAEMHLTELIRKGNLTADQQDVVEHALVHVRKTNRSLRAVLSEEVSKPDVKVAFLRDVVDDEIRFHIEEHGIPVDVLVGEEYGALPDSLVQPCHMFLHEALCNVRKHSKASTVVVMGSVRDGLVMLTVQDDGCGAESLSGGPDGRRPTDAPHFGISNLMSMAQTMSGVVELDFQPGEGCALRMRLPLSGA